MNKISQKLIDNAINNELESRFKPLWSLWCAWNGRSMSGNDFAEEVGKMFPKATHGEWQRRHLPAPVGRPPQEDDPLKALLV